VGLCSFGVEVVCGRVGGDCGESGRGGGEGERGVVCEGCRGRRVVGSGMGVAEGSLK